MAGRANIMATKARGEDAYKMALKVPCPQPKGRWNPRPHGEVITKLLEVSNDMGLRPDLDSMALTFTHENMARMFGTFPLKGLDRSEHGYQVGFTNSVDRSLSLRILFGTTVFVCSNGMFIGEFSERRMHTINIDVETTIKNVLENCQEAVIAEDNRLELIKDTVVENPEKMFFRAVKEGALAKSHIITAHDAYMAALDHDDKAEIEHPGTLWAFQNAVTSQWKRTRNNETMVTRSLGLKKMIDGIIQERTA